MLAPVVAPVVAPVFTFAEHLKPSSDNLPLCEPLRPGEGNEIC